MALLPLKEKKIKKEKKKQGEIKEVISTLIHFDLKASAVPISRVNNPAWVGKAGAEAQRVKGKLSFDPSSCLEFLWRNSSTEAGRLGQVWREFFVPE